MLATCLEGIAEPGIIVFHSYNQHFWRISAQFQILAILIRNLFSQPLWDTQNPCFWAVFGPLKITLTQLQAAVENFLSVTWPYNRYSGSTLGYKLSNAPTLMSIGWLQRSLTFLVQKVFFTAEKRPPLRPPFSLQNRKKHGWGLKDGFFVTLILVVFTDRHLLERIQDTI